MKAASPRMADRWNWKGGAIIRDGYRFIKLPDHPNARSNGYIAEHRLVLSEKIGRPLKPNELSHHINHDKLDNSPDNLVLVRRAAHSRSHRLERTLGRSGWSTYPNGCTECGTAERRHRARGLCERCYSRLRAREQASQRTPVPRKPHNRENMQRGADRPMAKLTETTIREIRATYAVGGVRMIDLAGRYGISLAAVHNVIHRKTWAHVP